MLTRAAVIAGSRQRSRHEEPSSTDATDPVRVFRLVDTVDNVTLRDQILSKDVRTRLRRREFKAVGTTIAERKAEARERSAAESQQARLRVVSRARGMADSFSGEFRMYDVQRTDHEHELDSLDLSKMPPEEAAIMCNFVPMLREYIGKREEKDYVYDLYCQFHATEQELANVLATGRVESFNENLIFDNEHDDDPRAGEYDDDSDSNDENNWRNDYPDEEESDFDSRASDEEAVQMREMERQMRRFLLRDRMATNDAGEPVHITGDDDFLLSSDDEDGVEDLVYGTDTAEVTTAYSPADD